MKKRTKLFALLCTVMLLASTFCGCFVGSCGYMPEYEAFELVGEPTLRWTYEEEYGSYEVTIDGVAKNVKQEDWNGVSITFLLYDAEGNGLGSAFDYIDYVAIDGTWRFCATGSTKYEPVSMELHEIYAYSN